MAELTQHKISKRTFLGTTAAAAATWLAWEPILSLAEGAPAAKPRRLSLNGDWRAAQSGSEEWIPARVPGCIHTDLMAAGKIPDPFFRDNEKLVQWITEKDWVFKRTFDVPQFVLDNDRVLLRCEGLDTLATIKLNGKEAGRADNMFRLWEFDAKPFLQPGENTIEVTFESPLTYINSKSTDQAPAKWVKGRAWVRKEPCSFNWDWGPDLASCGIWKNISLETFNRGRIDNILIVQDLSDAHKATLDITVGVEAVSSSSAFKAVVTVLDGKKTVAKKTFNISKGEGHGQLELKRPRLWWPAGMGDQPLYQVQVELRDEGGNPVDAQTKRIGLRELKIILPENGHPLHFEVNGRPFFSKGANWIPADSFPNRLTPEIFRHYVADAAAVNINTLRFWGGGYYEDDSLFDACDEMGICVWLDFKFACAAYPAFDGEFMENVRREARDNLQRLRHHPCIAVWCGNNEISLLNLADEWRDNTMNRADYDKLFKELLGHEVQVSAPQANYVSGSPDCGDTHYWDVWHGPKMFDAYRGLTGFMSEFGYQSFPEPKTIRSFTNEEDRASVVTPVMRWHQRSGGADGNQKMADMIRHYFNPPKDFETTLWLSQIVQGYGIKIGAEYWRQSMPRSMGCVFWQYNDIWPGMSWSSVDYFGRWKALHYLARRFYAPILVSGLENIPDGTIQIFVTSDLLGASRGELTWKITGLDGQSVVQGKLEVDIPAQKSVPVKMLDLREQINRSGANNLLTWLKLEVDGKTVSENLVLMCLPRELKLIDPTLETAIKESGEGFRVTIKSAGPALWTWLELENADAKFSDNFLHVTRNVLREIVVRPARPMTREELGKELRVRSLFDTYASS